MRALLFLAGLPLLAADADLILHHGKIVTVDARSTVAQALAVKGGRITRVGSDAEVLQERGPRTEVVDLGGKTVLPGLIDSHVHAMSAGLSEFREPLPPLDSFDDIQRFIRAKMKTTPKGEWIMIPRTFATRLNEMRIPTKAVLDVATEHPVLLDSSYVTVLNSVALRLSGITTATPNPPAGQIVKDEKGELTGILRNAPQLVKGLSAGRPFTEKEKLAALRDQLGRYRAAGLTSISDRAVTAEDIALYRQLRAANQLPVRAVLTWRLNAGEPVEKLVSTIRSADYTTGTGDEWLKFGAFKVTLDGGMIQGTAYQRFPYGQFGRQLYGETNPDSRGQLFVEPAKLYSILEAAYDKGWQLTAHSQGGGAVDNLLDAYEKLNGKRPIAGSRSHVMHASFQSPEAIARAKRLGVLADVQPAWLYNDAPALGKVVGHQTMRYFIPLRTYWNTGVLVAGGSDHMIGHDQNKATNPYNPFQAMWVAVSRRMRDGETLYPEEALTRMEALRMYTVNGAYMQFSEKEKGSLEPGKLADLVVIDRDLLTCPEDQIKDIRPVMVMVEGKR